MVDIEYSRQHVIVEINQSKEDYMELSPFSYYLIIINMIGFVLYLINTLLYRYTTDRKIDAILNVISLLGASLGIMICILIFDRKAEKENMMSRVFVSCILVIQIIVFLVIKGHLADNITFAFWDFFKGHKLVSAYLVIINFVTFVAFAIDKIAAMKHKSRIRIVTLIGLSFIGGAIGGLIGMYLFRHKIRKDYFTVGIPLIIFMQIVILFFAMNVSW